MSTHKSVITDFHAKYFAHELTIQHGAGGVDRLSQSLFDASVDLNPHQIEAALFALNNPLSKGVVLADEVGLGKTIEAALVLCQLWAERKRHLLIICPASLRRQWAAELQEKFNLPSLILDARTWNLLQKQGIYNPLNEKKVIILSYHYAARLEDQLAAIPWNLVVMDEAHKLRNAHRHSNMMGQALRRALDGRQKLLLTATPLQNSLMELYGLSTLLDEHLFGDEKSFRKQFTGADSDISELRERLAGFVKRTLRQNVLEYIRYTERKTITVPFSPTDQEQRLYDAVSAFLLKEESYALPRRQRHLTGLILRKLLASSSYAVINTLETIRHRLKAMREGVVDVDDDIIAQIIDAEELEADYLEDESDEAVIDSEETSLNVELLDREIDEISSFINMAGEISTDTKAKALIEALKIGFDQMQQTGAARKAVIFTESRRTQDYLYEFLSNHGYAGKLVSFSGTNNSKDATEIYHSWLTEHAGSDRVTGSPAVDRRSALIDHFKNHAEIFIATEAGAEGINLQFCSLLINYDLPWNPQRIEQRIGRCHRYGQKFDVVVINFINERNQADQRVLELLTDKFRLFDGVFGSSDEVLGKIESGIDFEKRILEIYESCRTQDEIERAFKQLQDELESEIGERVKETQQLLLEHFDEDIHDILKLQLDEANQRLDKVSRWFWLLTQHMLDARASFDSVNYTFDLHAQVSAETPSGKYQLMRKGKQFAEEKHAHLYRLTHPLGEHVLDTGRSIETPASMVTFDYGNHGTKISVIESLQGQSGWLNLNLLRIDAFQTEEYLVFSGMTDSGAPVDREACEKLFSCDGVSSPAMGVQPTDLATISERHVQSQLSRVFEANNQFFNAEREKLEKWADDKVLAAEQALRDTKAKMRSLKRESRMAESLEEQNRLQKELREAERLQRRQRQEIFDVEDDIMDKRDKLINALEQRLNQKTTQVELFTIRWTVK